MRRRGPFLLPGFLATWAIIAWSFPHPVLGSDPPIITLSERDEDGGLRKLRDPNIVDVMSVLDIAVDRDALRVRLDSTTVEGIPPELALRLQKLGELLQKRRSTLNGLADLQVNWQREALTGGPQPSAAFTEELAATANLVLDLLGLLPDDLQRSLEAHLNADLNSQYSAVYDAGAVEIDRLRSRLDGLAEEQGVSIQMGAWITTDNGTRPVHLDGFDTYPEGPDYVIKRWELSLNEQERAELEAVSKEARAIGESSNAILEFLRRRGEEGAAGILGASRTVKQVTEVLEQARGFESSLAEDQQTVRALLDSLRSDADDFVRTMSTLLARYRSPSAGAGMSGDEFLLGVDADIQRVIAEVTGLQARLAGHREALQDFAGDSRIGASVTGLISAIEACADAAADDVKTLRDQVGGFIAQLRGGRAVDVAALTFGNEVKKLTLGEVPETTQLELRSTGKRAAGDVIDLKISFFRADREPPASERALETRRVRMFRVLPHIERTVGLVFVHPIADSPVRHFQPAPGYSLLLKGLWSARGSIFYHSFLDPGIGINLAAPDLDKDDAPELGVGLVASLFRDILQGGFGYDLSEGKSYSFVVIRLPVPSS